MHSFSLSIHAIDLQMDECAPEFVPSFHRRFERVWYIYPRILLMTILTYFPALLAVLSSEARRDRFFTLVPASEEESERESRSHNVLPE